MKTNGCAHYETADNQFKTVDNQSGFMTTISKISPKALLLSALLWLGEPIFTSCSEPYTTHNEIVDDKEAPTLDIWEPLIYIKWDETFGISTNSLKIWNRIVASRWDNSGKPCTVKITQNLQEVNDWDRVIGPTVEIKVEDSRWNWVEKTITIEEMLVDWLENLKNLNMKVDQEVNLLQGVTFLNGAELENVIMELEWEEIKIDDPYHYTPEYPWVWRIILRVNKDNKSTEYTEDNITIKPLEYKEPLIEKADMIGEKYPRFNNLQESTKKFIYPHLVTSYAACNLWEQDNRVHIILWEAANTDDVEIIWDNYTTDHGYEHYHRTRAIAPETPIKCVNDTRTNLWIYLDQISDSDNKNCKVITCSADTWWWWESWESFFNENPETVALKKILDRDDVIVVCSDANQMPNWRKLRNENEKGGNFYKSASVNTDKKYNKITATWYNSWWDNHFSPSFQEHWWIRSALPIWFGEWNIVMPMIPLITSNNEESQISDSSFPTGVLGGTIWNAISVVMANNPWTTPLGAMTKIVNDYLRKEKFQYMDETTNRKLVDGGDRCFLDMEKLNNNELLKMEALNNIELNSDLIELPSDNWIWYKGKWIQFKFEWNIYDCSNEEMLHQALKAWNGKWYWNSNLFRKYGGKDTAKIDVYVVNKGWKSFLDSTIKKDVAIKSE